MDAFYASVEQMDNPALRGKPLAVGGNRERGVVAAASYEARKYGVRSAMSSKIAAQKCPQLIFVKPRFERYAALSKQIRAIFFDYTDLVEPLSLDEAFLDVTTNKRNNPSATLLAQEIRARIKAEVGLNASAGISYNKFLAKIASDLNKPNGQAVITPEQAEAFLEELSISRFFGIGKVTAEKMNKMGIYKGIDLKQQPLALLTFRFGKAGLHYYNIVRGIHNSPVNPDRIRKSLSAENTFERDIITQEEVESALIRIHDELIKRLRKSNTKGRTITLKIKYHDFEVHTRSRSFEQYIPENKLWALTMELLQQEKLTKAVRLFGIGLSNLNTNESGGEQLWLPYET